MLLFEQLTSHVEKETSLETDPPKIDKESVDAISIDDLIVETYFISRHIPEHFQ